MNELIHEIEDDIRRERFEQLWGKVGRAMVSASIAIVLATVGIVMWQNHKQSEAMRHTSQFIKGIDRLGVEDYAGAIAAFSELAADDHLSYYGLAMLRKAQAQDASGDHDGAAKTYQALANHDGVFGGLAKMMAPAPDSATAPLDMASPFYHTQEEWKAWQLVVAGKKDDAAAIFTSLRDDNDAPYSMRTRTSAVLQYMTPDLKQPTDKTKGTP